MAKIISWNINGIRSAHKKGFVDWLDSSDAEIVGVQEVRAKVEQIPKDLIKPQKFEACFQPAIRPGYSGVGFFSKIKIDNIYTSLGESRFDDEGRVQLAQFQKLLIANVYFPNGRGKDQDNGRIPYKLDFYAKLLSWLEPKISSGCKVLVIGDFNTAHHEIDLARPENNRNVSGFCQVERDEMTRWLDSGFIDTFRHFNSQEIKYSWWSNRSGARQRNIGWRIDYIFASKSAMPFIKNAFILDNTQGSDHCPVGIDVDDRIFI